MNGVRVLVAVGIRRDRWQTAAWASGMLIVALVSVLSTRTSYGRHEERVGALKLVIGNPAFLISRGMPQGPEPGTFLFFQMGMVLAVLFALHAVLTTARRGRGDEESGVAEMLRSGAIGPTANLVATLSAWAALAMLLIGMNFLAVGALCGQVVGSSRAATGLGVGVVTAAYCVRAGADARSIVDPTTLRGLRRCSPGSHR